MKIGLNGSIIDESDAQISVFDHGFMYGIGFFETFRTYHGRIFMLEQHIDRLKAGCQAAGIAYDWSLSSIQQWIAQLLEANQLKDAYIRYTISAGPGPLGLPTEDYSKPTHLLYMKPLTPPVSIQTGKRLHLLQQIRNTPEGAFRWKSLHYMNNILARRELLSLGLASDIEGLFLTGQGFVAEGIVSNVFFAKNGICCTPSIDTGILPGITRAFIIQIAGHAGLKVEEGHYTWKQLTEADEIFLTNSIQEIVSVRELTAGVDSVIRLGQNRPITEWLQRIYRGKIKELEG